MINKFSDTPLYSQLKNLILKKIESGEYPENSRIPSEQEFCEIYDISRPTVRQAISELTSSGYLYKEKGKGTFVSRSKSKVDIRNYSGFTDSILDCDIPGARQIISMERVLSSSLPRAAEIFNLAYNQKVDLAEIRYVAKQNNELLSMNVSYIPLGLFPEIMEDVNNRKPSYEILKGKYPLLPVRTKSSMEIIFTDRDEALYLQVQQGQPLLRIDNIMYSKSGQAVEYVISKYRADKCRLLFENTKQ